jgi:putative restriction endonuclease
VRYWWVNQKQTHRHEIAGGYLWSPKRRANGDRNQFYENMKEVRPGDVVFSYWEGHIRARGTVLSFGYDAPKPDEFGSTGRYWDKVGYRVDVEYMGLDVPLAPRSHWDAIKPLLPAKYSPLNPSDGKGLQSVYLAELPELLGLVLNDLLATTGNKLLARDARGILLASKEEVERSRWEDEEERQLEIVSDTDRDALIKARRGQGVFRQNVARVEGRCRITHIENPTYLIASHIKPWRHADNIERLSGENGLLLAPQADFLFDRGFISFEDGRLLVSPVADERSLVKLGVDPDRPPEVGGFSDAQERFLEFHRAQIFRSAGQLKRSA